MYCNMHFCLFDQYKDISPSSVFGINPLIEVTQRICYTSAATEAVRMDKIFKCMDCKLSLNGGVGAMKLNQHSLVFYQLLVFIRN